MVTDVLAVEARRAEVAAHNVYGFHIESLEFFDGR